MWDELVAKLRIRWPKGYKEANMQEWEVIDTSTINELVDKVTDMIQYMR